MSSYTSEHPKFSKGIDTLGFDIVFTFFHAVHVTVPASMFRTVKAMSSYLGSFGHTLKVAGSMEKFEGKSVWKSSGNTARALCDWSHW